MAAPKPSRPPTPEYCPVCGEDVPPRALACPECGADHNTGWKEGALIYDGLDLPEDGHNAEGFQGGNYEEFMRREFGPRWNWWPPNIKWLWWAVAVLLLLAMLLGSGVFTFFRVLF